jgi:hypothetical protein
MINYQNRSLRFVESYSLNNLGKINLQNVLKMNNLPLDVYLENVALEFKEKFIVEEFFGSSDILMKELFSNLKPKLKKQIRIENNSLFIPIEEFLDTINFGIFVEVESLLDSNLNEFEIKKLSSVLNSPGEKSESVTPENTFLKSEVIEILESISWKYTKNTEIKNDYLIVTFD